MRKRENLREREQRQDRVRQQGANQSSVCALVGGRLGDAAAGLVFGSLWVGSLSQALLFGQSTSLHFGPASNCDLKCSLWECSAGADPWRPQCGLGPDRPDSSRWGRLLKYACVCWQPRTTTPTQRDGEQQPGPLLSLLASPSREAQAHSSHPTYILYTYVHMYIYRYKGTRHQGKTHGNMRHPRLSACISSWAATAMHGDDTRHQQHNLASTS